MNYPHIIDQGAEYEAGHGWSGFVHLALEGVPTHRAHMIGHLGFLPSRMAAITTAKCCARRLHPEAKDILFPPQFELFA